MLVYFEDFLVEHLAGAISSVGTEWQKRKQNGKKETKHVNNAERKQLKEQIKKQDKKGGDDIS